MDRQTFAWYSDSAELKDYAILTAEISKAEKPEGMVANKRWRSAA